MKLRAISLIIFMGLMLSASAPFSFAAPVLPAAPDSYILDEASVLSPETEAALQTQLAQLETDTSSQIAIATVLTLQDYPIEQFSIELAREWGIGQEGNDNGLLLLIVKKDLEAGIDGEVRIEVGYGLEGVVTDAQSNAIIDNVMIPYLAQGDYDNAVLQGVLYLDALTRGEDFTSPQPKVEWNDLIFPILFFGFSFLGYLANSKAWWLGGVFGGIIGLIFAGLIGLGIGVFAGLFVDYFASKYLFGKIGGGGSGRFGGGFGGSGGGFGGFGGGGFGGGGGSGRF